jgi:hypothetical protein
MFIPDTNFIPPVSWIPDLRSRNPDLGSWISDLGSWIPDPGTLDPRTATKEEGKKLLAYFF